MAIKSYSARIESSSGAYMDVVSIAGSTIFGVSCQFGTHVLVFNKTKQTTELYSLENENWMNTFSEDPNFEIILKIKDGKIQKQ